jgi:hypothetical protein
VIRKSCSKTINLVICLVISVIMFAVGAEYAQACSCVGNGPPLEELGKATAVFSGRVIERDETAVLYTTADPVRVTFQVYTVWKGPVCGTIIVTTAYSEVSCGYEFQEGEEYLVYAHGSVDNLEVSLCSRTRLLAGASQELSELGDGLVPPAESSGIFVLAGVGTVVVMLTVTIFVLRRRLLRNALP